MDQMCGALKSLDPASKEGHDDSFQKILKIDLDEFDVTTYINNFVCAKSNIEALKNKMLQYKRNNRRWAKLFKRREKSYKKAVHQFKQKIKNEKIKNEKKNKYYIVLKE